MTGYRDSAAASGATTRPVPDTPDLAQLGSHLTNQSSTPEIRVHQHEAQEAWPYEGNGDAVTADALLPYHNDAESTNGGPWDAKRSRGRRTARYRADSLIPGSSSDTGCGASVDSSSSNNGFETESEDDGVVTPMTRRCSFVSEDLQLEHEEHHEDSLSDSTPAYSEDDFEDSDSDDSRPYTNLQMPAVPVHGRSRGTSVVSDGGEQNHLELKQSTNTQPESSRVVKPKSVGTKSPRYALQKQIWSAMEIALDGDASSTGQQFLPKDQLCQVINTTTVCAELANCLPSSCETGQIEKYAETICSITPCYVNGRVRQRSYRSIFAILVLAERSSFILSFIEEQVSDLDLPLVPVKECRNLIGMRRRSSGPNQSPQPLLDSFNDEDWSPSSREQFDRYQWYMLAPFFSKGRHGQINHYPLHDHHILPFVTWNQAEDDNAESQGGYGRVIMVKLHPAHHKLKRKTYNDRGFAVKQLLQNDRKSFRKEREMLKKFSGANSHPHIVSLLATYRHRNKYHFIFDRAQGDLGKLWGKYETLPDLSHNDIVWIADQCLGITKGLFMIHRHRTFRKRCISETEDQADDRDRQGRVTFSKTLAPAASDGMAPKNDSKFVTSDTTTNRTFSIENDDPEHYEIRYGRHGDLNPQNILWFTEESEEPGEMACILRGTLRIADFGTAEMNSLWSKSGIRDVANTMTYRPPECDSADRTIRQSFDIWCLGCVFLEFVTWTLGGAHLVRKFAMKRAQCDPYTNVDSDTYFELVWNESTHKTEARIKPAVFEFVKKLHSKPRCTEFHHKLLNLVMHDMLLVDSRKRLSCRDIGKELKRLRSDCQSKTYATEPRQWCNGEHVSPEILQRSSEVKLSKEAQRLLAKNLPLPRVANAF